jgi:RNase adaptor protein for sRNA GlmZ degradation
VYTFGLEHCGLGCRYKDVHSDQAMKDAMLWRFDNVPSPDIIVDCRKDLNDSRCPYKHSGLHVDFLQQLIYMKRFDQILAHVKEELIEFEANNVDNDRIIIAMACKAGTHRSVGIGNVLANLSALNIIHFETIYKII